MRFKQDPRATGDFETRSVCELKKAGGWLYSKHETTEVMCFAYRLPWWPAGMTKLWHRAHPEYLIGESPPPLDLFEALESGLLFEAHNAFFEWCIWNNKMVPEFGWPKIDPAQWRCSAAKASAAALPRALGWACDVMRLPVQKDDAGHKLMLKMCKPRRARKAEIDQFKADNPEAVDGLKMDEIRAIMPTLWYEEEEDIYRQWDYCKVDVLAEEGLSEVVPDLTPYELRVWQADQKVNQNGVMVDLELCHAAVKMASDWKVLLNQELHELTGIAKGTQRKAVREWLLEWEKVELEDTTAETVEWHIEHGDLSGRAKRVCEILTDVNRTSTNKYVTMIRMADKDDHRVRDHMKYCGAERTGRWAGSGIQVHNFPDRDLILKDFDFAVMCIKTGDVKLCQMLYGDVMKLLSHALRGALIPSKGKKFAIADYASIEARVVLWLANAKEALQVFYEGKDIYCDMASGIYGYEVTKAQNSERQFGKQAILGLGFGMGYLTFLLTCRKYKITFTRKQVRGILGDENYVKYRT